MSNAHRHGSILLNWTIDDRKSVSMKDVRDPHRSEQRRHYRVFRLKVRRRDEYWPEVQCSPYPNSFSVQRGRRPRPKRASKKAIRGLVEPANTLMTPAISVIFRDFAAGLLITSIRFLRRHARTQGS